MKKPPLVTDWQDGGRVWTESGERPGLSELVDTIKVVWFKLTF